MAVDLAALLAPGHTAVLTMELQRGVVGDHAAIPELTKVDEIPFDCQRRIMSVVVRTPEGKDRARQNALKHGLTARRSVITSGLDTAALSFSSAGSPIAISSFAARSRSSKLLLPSCCIN